MKEYSFNRYDPQANTLSPVESILGTEMKVYDGGVEDNELVGAMHLGVGQSVRRERVK